MANNLVLIAVGLLALAYLIKETFVDFTPLNAQVDATLKTMADAVEQMRVGVAAIAAAPGDTEAVNGIVARLKAGTDTLAAAIEATRKAMSK